MEPPRRRTPPGLARGAPRLALLVAFAAASARPASAAPTDSVTIAECVALARARAPEVQALAAEARAAGEDSIAASLNRRPSYSLFGGATAAPSGFYDPVATNLGEYSLRLGMQLPLRDAGERRRSRLQAGLTAAGAAAERDLAAREAGLRAAAVALELLRHRELERAGREMQDWLERLAALIESGVRAGARDRADAVRVRLERDGLEADLLVLESERTTLGRELAQLTGREAGGEPAIIEPDSSAERAPSEADSLALFAAADSASEVRAARAAEAGQRLELEAARARNALRMDLSADAGWWGTDLTRAVPEELRLTNPDATFADRLRRDLGASVALDFHRPLLDPGTRPAAQAQEERLRGAARRTQTALAERQRAALDLLARWRSAARRLELARGSLGRSEEHSLRMRSLYAGGATSLLELLDARQQLDEARKRLADARLETRLAHWEEALQR